MPDEGVLSAPIYDVGEMARLAQLPGGKVRRWVEGYSFPVGPERRRREQEPVLQRGVSAPEQASFLDLIELRLARAFLQDGFSLQRLRLAFREAAEVTGLDHPFARKRVLTSGGKIFLEVQAPRRRSPKHLLELLSGGQWVIPEIVETYANQIDFDPTSEAASR